MSNTIFMPCHYNDNIVLEVNNSITYNDESNLLLIGNLGMSYIETKEIICHELGWNYNNNNVEITWRCQISEYQYYPISIVCDDSFKTMSDYFIQSGLKMMILCVSSRPKFVCVSTSAGLSNSVDRGKNSFLSDDLLQMINDIMFDNRFAYQHRFAILSLVTMKMMLLIMMLFLMFLNLKMFLGLVLLFHMTRHLVINVY